MKKKKIIIIAIFILLIIIAAAYLYTSKKKLLEVKEIDMYLTVANYTGFNIDTEAIFFGTVIKGGTARRIITINNYHIESNVFIVIEGDLKKWVSISDNNFTMHPNESRNITISTSIPQNAEFKNYTGKLRILFKKAR